MEETENKYYKKHPFAVDKVCENCGNKYTAKTAVSKYCIDCKKIVYQGKNYPERNCVNCNRIFKPKSLFNKFCNRNCQLNVRKKLEISRAVVREYFLEKFYFTCGKCSKMEEPNNLDIHHIIPLYKGGEDKEENIKVLCRNCHKKEHKIW